MLTLKLGLTRARHLGNALCSTGKRRLLRVGGVGRVCRPCSRLVDARRVDACCRCRVLLIQRAGRARLCEVNMSDVCVWVWVTWFDTGYDVSPPGRRRTTPQPFHAPRPKASRRSTAREGSTSTSPLPHEQHLNLALPLPLCIHDSATLTRRRQHLHSLTSDRCCELTLSRPSLVPEPQVALQTTHTRLPASRRPPPNFEPCRPATAPPSSTRPCRPFAPAPPRLRHQRARRRSRGSSTRASSGAWRVRSQRTSRRRRTSCRSWRSVSLIMPGFAACPRQGS